MHRKPGSLALPALTLATLGMLAACGGTVFTATGDAATGDDAGADDAATDGGTSTHDAGSDATTTPPADGGADTGVDFTHCTGPGTCTLVDRACCGVCGVPTAADKIGVVRGDETAYRDAVCAASGGGVCAGCAEGIEPNLQAFCRASTCQVIDVRTDSVSSCTADSDCRVRVPDCCECGASTSVLIALSTAKVAEYESQVCAPGTGCADCAPVYPPRALARCNTSTHHCELLLAP
jgi:hypothetical protein